MALVISIVEAYKDEMRMYEGSLGNFILEKYQQGLRTDEFKDIDGNVSQQFLEFFHKYENSIEASDTWFDTSCKGYCEYWDCDGDRLLNWKDKGYRTVFDLLMVNPYSCIISRRPTLGFSVLFIALSKHVIIIEPTSSIEPESLK